MPGASTFDLSQLAVDDPLNAAIWAESPTVQLEIQSPDERLRVSAPPGFN